MDNKIDLVHLKHNIEMLRIQKQAFTDLLDTHEETEYLRGINHANKQYDKYINRLEKIMEGVNIYE